MSGTKESCTCAECQAECVRKPGWFMPGEAEKAAELLGVSLERLFRTHLMADYWEADGTLPLTYVLSPAVVSGKPGGVFPKDPHGTCVFFVNGRCSIHAAKPHECREAFHGTPLPGVHRGILDAWNNPEAQAQIERLLGAKPLTGTPAS